MLLEDRHQFTNRARLTDGGWLLALWVEIGVDVEGRGEGMVRRSPDKAATLLFLQASVKRTGNRDQTLFQPRLFNFREGGQELRVCRFEEFKLAVKLGACVL